MKQAPIRVLHIVGRMDQGGIETLLMNLYRAMDRNLVQFDFLAHYGREAAYNDEIRALGGRIYEMPALKDERRVYYQRVFAYLFALHRFFREHKEYRILHGHMTNTASLYLPIAKRYGVACRIAHSHSTRSKPGLQGIMTTLLQKPVHLMATAYFACSRSAAHWLFPSVPEEQIRIFPNAIDLERFRYQPEIRQRIRRSLGLTDGPVIICVARFRPEKNQMFLLDVLPHILAQRSDAAFLFVGDGPCEEAVRAATKAVGLAEHIRFLGPRSDVADLLNAADAFVLPSLWEGLPVTGIEALANGLHGVVSDGVPDEWNQANMVTFLPLQASPKLWADALLFAAAQPRTDVFDQLRAAGYDIHTAAAQLQKFYLQKHTEAMR